MSKSGMSRVAFHGEDAAARAIGQYCPYVRIPALSYWAGVGVEQF